ncbi:hypothetical protein QE152_g34394 [Popillia japonica]|uniref:Uncharacterized protein n=1 Tax=Popillia japonica TaxID=7064 RepID=A0AAW1IT69_POPJA
MSLLNIKPIVSVIGERQLNWLDNNWMNDGRKPKEIMNHSAEKQLLRWEDQERQEAEKRGIHWNEREKNNTSVISPSAKRNLKMNKIVHIRIFQMQLGNI